jgi:hypothetical protein
VELERMWNWKAFVRRNLKWTNRKMDIPIKSKFFCEGFHEF